MGKFRSKLKGQTKGKRWPKGQSSSSNPETRKYRDQARSRFFQANLGSSNLTSDALKRHDAIQALAPRTSKQDSASMDEEDIATSISSYQTMQSFASEWSDCSNMSYNRFLKVFRSDSALHKEMLAILAAVTEVIKENGGNETPVEYYCALLTTLEQILSSDNKTESQITAVLSLLNMGIKTVSEAVLKSSFDEVSKKVLLILNKYSNTENNVIVKSIFGILSALLRAQDLGAWKSSTAQDVFYSILNPFCIHSKPKWRKSAQQAIAGVIRSDCFAKDGVPNVAADKVAEFCEQTLDSCMGGNSGTVLVSSIQAGQTTILHTLGLMKETIQQFSKTHMKKCCETILRLMTLNYPIVTSCGLQVLHTLFSSQKAVVPAKLNGQLISALYEYQPAVHDVQPTLAWLAVMQQAHIHLSDVDIEMSCTALPRVFSTITHLWLSEKPEIMTAATHSLEALLQDAVAPACESSEFVKLHHSKLAKCFNAIELGLGYQYHNAWHQVLHIIRVMFEVGGANSGDLLKGCLKSLSELRDSYKFSYNNELEHAVGAAIRSMGPESVLSVISLKRENGDLNLDRSWLLPVLKENIKKSTLEFWVNGILPLAIYCQTRSVQLSEKNDGIGAHSSELLHLQLWNLLPSFCHSPVDIKTSFKSIAKVLGTAISDRKELRLAVMASLRKLIACAKASENADDLAEISRFDKNYLPILFNVYTTKAVGSDEEGQRLAALETVKAYLSVARPELTKQLFNNALEKLDSTTASEEPFLKESIMDLIRALVPYQGSEEIDQLYQHCVKNLENNKNGREQKKTYRLLEEICGSDADGCKAFIEGNRKNVQKVLMKSLDSAAVSSKGARLRCLTYLIKAQPQLDYESKLLKSVIPEAVLCCKDINERCRTAAYQLINLVGETLQNHNQTQQFVTMLIAGLAGTPQLMGATILALTSVLHNFSGALGQENINLILDNICLLVSCPTREIVAPSLSFIKVYCTTLPSPMVAASLSKIIKTLCNMTDDCKRHFRLKVRDILDRLVRKYGCESITPHVPASDTVMYKRLRNLRKINSRKKKLKEEKKKGEGSDDDEEFIVKTKPKSVEEILADSDSDFDDMETDQQKVTKKKHTSAWIEEDAETIVDFTDPSVSSKITATKPGQQPTQTVEKKKDRGFKTASDGRLIIEDDSGDSDAQQKSSHKLSSGDSDSDDNQSRAETLALSDRKRKRSESGSVKSVVSLRSQPPNKYKAGGSGIHRPLASSSSVHSGAGREYKSNKASGDVKKKGKFDPYAYLPLQRSSLNKRKKMKSAGKFKHIIGAAKVGAKKGLKAKKNKNKF